MGDKSEDGPFDPTETIAESRDATTNVEPVQPTKFDPSVTQPLKPAFPPTAPLRRPESAVDEKAQTQMLSASQLKTGAAVGPPARKVGKLKKVSSVVLDQAAYDPSVRFLLVAAGLFILFVVLLVLSKVLG